MSIIKTNNKGLLIVVSGPSGAGKGTINGELLKRNKNIWMSTSMTTREPRGTEENGKEYFFVSKEEFEERIKNDQLLEYAIVHSGKYYGTPKDKIYDKLDQGIDVILEIDIQSALSIQNKIRNHNLDADDWKKIAGVMGRFISEDKSKAIFTEY